MNFDWTYFAIKDKQDAYESIIDKLNIYDPNTIATLPDAERKEIINKIIAEIRKINVFPIFYFTPEGVKKEIQSVRDKDVAFNTDDTLSIFSSHGLLVLDYLFPNLHLATSYAGKQSMWDRFYDDKSLYDCIDQYIRTNKINNMRTVFFSTARYLWNTPINFSPLRAKAIFERFCPANGVIYDYSAGYGGRMLGALASKNNYYYIGTDPNTETYNNLLRLGGYIYDLDKNINSNLRYKIYSIGSEILKLAANTVDFAFSCPPFFDLEVYSDEDTQSIKQYPVYEDWLNCYVRQTITNCYIALKDEGLFGVDLMNFWTHGQKHQLTDDWITIAKEEGFYLKGIFPIKTRARKSDEDKENIYIFTKKKDLSIPNYTNQKTLNNYLKTKEENKDKSYRRNHVTVAIYDVWGKLTDTYDSYKEAATALGVSIDGLKLSNYVKFYYGNDKILETIKVKQPVCKIEDIYYYSLSDAARALRISRQAVSQAKMKKKDNICNHKTEWY